MSGSLKPPVITGGVTLPPAPGVRQILEQDLLAVLVLYQTPLEQSPTFLSLRTELRALAARVEILVCDNSPAPSDGPAAAAFPEWTVQYRHDPSNPGVSAAYLAGARLAAEAGKCWLLFLDQDTRFPPGALAAYVEAVQRYPEIRLFAPILRAGDLIVSPCAYSGKRGLPLSRIESGVHSLSGLSVLNSGMWVAVEEYLAVGGHDPQITLDFSDHEFVQRYKRRHGSFAVVDAECSHGLSASSPQPLTARLARFRSYCRAARYASRGPGDLARTIGLVSARACLLSLRHRHAGFLRVALASLLESGHR